jgi:protein TonB
LNPFEPFSQIHGVQLTWVVVTEQLDAWVVPPPELPPLEPPLLLPEPLPEPPPLEPPLLLPEPLPELPPESPLPELLALAVPPPPPPPPQPASATVKPITPTTIPTRESDPKGRRRSIDVHSDRKCRSD